MSKLAQRIAAVIVMVAVVMGATVWGAAGMTISYKEIRSDAPVVMTINGDEVRADEYAGILQLHAVLRQHVRPVWHY